MIHMNCMSYTARQFTSLTASNTAQKTGLDPCCLWMAPYSLEMLLIQITRRGSGFDCLKKAYSNMLFFHAITSYPLRRCAHASRGSLVSIYCHWIGSPNIGCAAPQPAGGHRWYRNRSGTNGRREPHCRCSIGGFMGSESVHRSTEATHKDRRSRIVS